MPALASDLCAKLQDGQNQFKLMWPDWSFFRATFFYFV